MDFSKAARGAVVKDGKINRELLNRAKDTLTFTDDGTFILNKDGRYTYEKGSYATKGKIKVEGEQVYMSDNYFDEDDIWAPINGENAERMKKFLKGS